MPRSQRVKLNKSPVTEVAAGEFDSGVVKTQKFAAQKAVKTPGQELAEAIGIVAKGATLLNTDYKKSIENEEIINWSLYGDQMGRKLQETLADTPLEKRSDVIEAKLDEFRGDFEKYSGPSGVSQGGFRAGLGAFTQHVGAAEDNLLKIKLDIKMKRAQSGVSQRVKTMMQEGSSLGDILKYAAGNTDLYLSDREAQVDVMRSMAEVANVAMSNNPNMDMEAFIKQHMTGKSLDGKLDLYAIKPIKEIIDNLRRDYRVNKQGFNATTLEAKTKFIQDTGARTYTQLDAWNDEGVLTPNMYDTLKNKIDSNQTDYLETNRDSFYKGIIEGTTGLKDLNAALDRKEISVPQHNSLVAEYHSNLAKQSDKRIFQTLTADFGSNMTQGRYVEMVSKKNADGGLVYKPNAVKQAYKAVLQNEWTRIAKGGFSDSTGLRSLFANASGIVKLEAFENALNNITVTLDGQPGKSIQDILNSNLDSSAQNALFYNKMKATAQLTNIARANGYRSKSIVDFEKDMAIFEAEATIDPANALYNYSTNATNPDRNKVAGAGVIAKELLLHAPELFGDADEFRVIQAPFLADVYNAARNRPNSSPIIAAQATASFVRRTMVQVDVQGSGAFSDDQIWVTKASGITDQDRYDHVSEKLAEYYGFKDTDELQLYDTDVANEDSKWYLRNETGQEAIDISPILIRRLASSSEDNWLEAFTSLGYPAKYTRAAEFTKKGRDTK